jgi:glc operon protein GlcG
MIERRMLGLDEADKIVDAIVAHTKQQNGIPVSVAVVDSRGDLLKFVRMDGASWNSIQVAQSKAYSAAKFRRDTSAVADWMTGMNIQLTDWGDPRLTSIGGGVVVWDESVSPHKSLGAVGVSGWPKPSDDVEYARIGIAALG